MQAALLLQKPEIARQIKATVERSRHLAKLPPGQAKQEALKLLVAAGIYTKQGKLSRRYR